MHLRNPSKTKVKINNSNKYDFEDDCTKNISFVNRMNNSELTQSRLLQSKKNIIL